MNHHVSGFDGKITLAAQNFLRNNRVPPGTIKAMIASLDADLSLSPTRRRDLKSALKTLLRVTGGSENLPATVPTLRTLVGQMDKAPGGLSKRRRETLRSDIRAACCLVGFIPRRPNPSDLGTSWQILKEAAPDIWLWRRICQLAYWASVNGLEPFDVDASAFERFAAYLRNDTLEQDPERKLGVVAKAWNQLRQVVATPSKSGSVTPPAVFVRATRTWVSGGWNDLPASFVSDLETYCRSVASGSLLLDESTPEKPLRPATIHGHRQGFRRAGFMLLAAGFPAERLLGIRTLVEPDPFRLWVEAYHARLGRNSPALFNLIAALAAWARRTGAVPEAQIKVMRRAMTRIGHRRQEGMTLKNRDRIRQFSGALTRVGWLSYGERLVKDAKGLSPQRAALRCQTALIHEIMLVAPLRLTNLVQLRIGVNLVWQHAARQDRLFLVIPSAKVKNSVDLEFELPLRVAKLYRRYIETMRPLLLVEGDASDWLWPGAKPDTHKTNMTLSDQLIRRVRSDLGLAVNLHLYRHLAAWFYLQARPGDYETIRRLLGHKSIQTTINYYIEIDQMMISRNFNAVLDDLRSRPLPR